jgi:hypothetical protein
MSFWKILTSPNGAEGCRASVDAAVRRHIKRAQAMFPPHSFSGRSVAVREVLELRYRVARRDYDPRFILCEAAPLAWLNDDQTPALVAEYVVDQEFPGKSAKWLAEAMPGHLHTFVTARPLTTEMRDAVGGIYLFLTLAEPSRLPHWSRWLGQETLGVIYDIGHAQAALYAPRDEDG